MRALAAVLFALLAACELQPAPKKQPEPPPPAAPVEPVQPAPPPPAPADAGVADAGGTIQIEISAPCMEVAAKLAQVFIDAQKDPAQKSIAEQARADMTRKMGVACTVQGWSDEARKCYLAAKSEPDIRACEKKFPAPAQPPKPTAPVGTPPAGSAAPAAPTAPAPGKPPGPTGPTKANRPTPAKPT
jgi:hypothetical protein